MKKLNNTKNTAFILLSSIVFLSGCADWKSKPVTVDENFGNSVRNMVEAQTLNPGSAYGDQPALGIDGQKSQGTINSYRAAGTSDLKGGRETVDFDLDSN